VRRTDQLGAPVLVVHPAKEWSQSVKVGSPLILLREQSAGDVSSECHRETEPSRNDLHKNLRYSPNHLDLNVSCQQEGWLMVNGSRSSGWRARVNGNLSKSLGELHLPSCASSSRRDSIQFYYDQTTYLVLVGLSWSTLATVFTLPDFKSPFHSSIKSTERITVVGCGLNLNGGELRLLISRIPRLITSVQCAHCHSAGSNRVFRHPLRKRVAYPLCLLCFAGIVFWKIILTRETQF